MPYPPQFFKDLDLRKAQDNGDKLSATELCAELANIGTSLNQTIAFVRAITTADMKIQPNQILGTTFVIEDEQTATASQTEIFYAGGVTVDPLTATVGVFIDGDRLPASQTTVGSASVIVTPALSAGQNIMLEIHDNADSVFSELASLLNAKGASLIGLEDIAGLYASTEVESALAEVKALLDDFIVAVGDLTKYLKADVAVPFEIDQDAAGFTIKNLKAAIDPNDPVILSQVQQVLDILTNLENTFLPLTGGVMSGPINMGDNRIVSVPTPVADTDGANKKYVDDSSAAVSDAKLSLIGSEDSVANATLTGPVFLEATNDADVADVDQTSNPVAVAQPTLNNAPRPSTNRQVANKVYVDDAITSQLSGIQLQDGIFLTPDTATTVVGAVTVNKIATGHHRITVPVGVIQIFLGQLGGGGGGGNGDATDGGPGGKSYFTKNAGADQDLGLAGGGGLGLLNGATGGAGGAIGAAATYGEIGIGGLAGSGAAGGGDGGLSATHGGSEGAGGVATGRPGRGFGTGGGGAVGGFAGGGGGGGGGGYGEAFITVVATDIVDIFTGAAGAPTVAGAAGATGFSEVRF